MKRKKKCPDCNGKGGWFIPVAWPFNKWYHPVLCNWQVCPKCEGKGEIDD